MCYLDKLKDILGQTKYQHWSKIQSNNTGSVHNWLSEEELEELAKTVVIKLQGEKR